MTQSRVVAFVLALGAFGAAACGGSATPATDPNNATGTNPSPNTTGPGAGEPTDSNPDPATQGAGTNTEGPRSTSVGATDGANGSGPGNTNAGAGVGSGSTGH